MYPASARRSGTWRLSRLSADSAYKAAGKGAGRVEVRSSRKMASRLRNCGHHRGLWMLDWRGVMRRRVGTRELPREGAFLGARTKCRWTLSLFNKFSLELHLQHLLVNNCNLHHHPRGSLEQAIKVRARHATCSASENIIRPCYGSTSPTWSAPPAWSSISDSPYSGYFPPAKRCRRCRAASIHIDPDSQTADAVELGSFSPQTPSHPRGSIMPSEAEPP